jgi:hypothetical protein
MTILDTYNELCQQYKLKSEQLKAERDDNEALRNAVKDICIKNSNLHVAAAIKRSVVYRLNGKVYGADHICDFDLADAYSEIVDLYEHLDGDHSQIPQEIKDFIRGFENNALYGH